MAASPPDVDVEVASRNTDRREWKSLDMINCNTNTREGMAQERADREQSYCEHKAGRVPGTEVEHLIGDGRREKIVVAGLMG